MNGCFLAIDLGTTSLSGCLIDSDGEALAETNIPNPQAAFGADVLRRLEVSRDGRGEELQSALVTGINALLDDLLNRAGRSRESIAAAAAAANPAISTLLQNLPAVPILSPPYRPSNCNAVRLDPASTGLDLPVSLYLFPMVNGFVGGDLVAFLFGQDEPTEPTLYIDIGTNGEIALFADGRWWVTSVAAGPAFEGGEISSGTLYGPGAIAGCRVEGDSLQYDIVGNMPPKGVCGSGLAEIVAAAREVGLIDSHGSIISPEAIVTNLSRYVVAGENGVMLQLYRDARLRIGITQKDIRNFQLAKAAVHAGVDCLLQKTGIRDEHIGEVILTGAFGLSLSKRALKRVALLPENMVDKVRFEPGGALKGVGRMLLLDDGPGRVDNFAGMLKPYPLSGTPAFEKAFLSAIDF